MMRSIADIGRSHGEDFATNQARIACLEVFALGGRNKNDDSSESGYFAIRVALARSVTEAAEYLAEKGFVKDERDHRFWYFFYKGKKTRIRTKISTGSGYSEYGINLLNMIKKQLYLSFRELEALLRCPMDVDRYTELMIERRVISPN
jgi:hypothetical protein